MSHYTCEAEEYSSEVLKYKYTQLPSFSISNFWLSVRTKLHLINVAELLKSTPDQLPESANLPAFGLMSELNDNLSDVMRRVPKPETWSYIDYQIPHWSVEWAAKLAQDRARAARLIAASHISVTSMRGGELTGYVESEASIEDEEIEGGDMYRRLQGYCVVS